MQRAEALYGPLEEPYGRGSRDAYFTSLAVSFHGFALVQILPFEERDIAVYILPQ